MIRRYTDISLEIVLNAIKYLITCFTKRIALAIAPD